MKTLHQHIDFVFQGFQYSIIQSETVFNSILKLKKLKFDIDNKNKTKMKRNETKGHEKQRQWNEKNERKKENEL